MTGKIKVIKNGYGFIGIEGEKDIFFHANDLKGVAFDSLKVGDDVSFEKGSSAKGPKAENIQLA